MHLTTDLVNSYQGCQFEIVLRTYFFEIFVFGEISAITLKDEKLHITGNVFAQKDISRGKAPTLTRPDNPIIELVIDPKDYAMEVKFGGKFQFQSWLCNEALTIYPIGHINFDPAKAEGL